MGYRTGPIYCHNQDTKFVVLTTTCFVDCEIAATFSINLMLEGGIVSFNFYFPLVLLDNKPQWIRRRVAQLYIQVHPIVTYIATRWC